MNKQQQLMKKIIDEKKKNNNCFKTLRPTKNSGNSNSKVNPRISKNNGGGLFS